jgi:regulator of protease activity HflC (stomatin/prohibitin superfamily)
VSAPPPLAPPRRAKRTTCGQSAVEIKDIVLPDNMQRAMAKEAEAERERRAKIVAAEGEYQAAVKLGQAADIITQNLSSRQRQKIATARTGYCQT